MTVIDPSLPDALPFGTTPSAGIGAGRRQATAWRRSTLPACAAALGLALALAFLRWRIADAVVPWDSKNHFYPMFRFLADALRHGTLPLWNPYHFSGYPAIADPQSLIFTPSMMLFALIAPDASMAAFDGVIALHLFVGGLGVLVLARSWRWHPLAALLGALVFTMGGAAASRLEHTGMIVSYIYFPWALWSLLAALQTFRLRWGFLAGLFVALMALGRDQVAFMFCLALVGALVHETVASPAPLRDTARRLPPLVAASFVTLACMIVPILLSLQFIHDSNRPSITYGVALSGSLNPINLLTLIAPNVFGSLDHVYDYWGPGTGLIAGNDWSDKTDRTMDYMFIGVVPIALVLWQGFAAGRLMERGTRLCLAMGAFIVVYAFGRHTPFFGLIFDWVPGVSLYRRPADAVFPINAALALAAGLMLHRFIVEGLPRPRLALPRWLAWSAPAATLLGGGALVGGGLAFASTYRHLDASLLQLGVAAGLFGFVILACVMGRRRRVLTAAVLVAATAGDLLWHNAASPLNAEPVSTYSAYNGLYAPEAAGLAALRADIAQRQARGERPRVEIIGVNGSWQNAAMVLKLEDTIGYNPLRISNYERAVGVWESATEIDYRRFPGLFRGYCSRLASLLGLDYLVLDRPLEQLPRHFPRPRADLLYAGESFYVYRLATDPVPRALFVASAKAVDSDEVIASETLPDFDRHREALIDTADVPALHATTVLNEPAPGTPPGTAAITRYEDNAVSVAVDAAKAGILVLHDLAYPGWTVSVDGAPARLLRMNVLFRGVEVPAGHHDVTFTFKPLTLANLADAAASLLRKRKS